MGIASSLGKLRSTVQAIGAYNQLLEPGSDADAAAQEAEHAAVEARAMWLGAMVEAAYIVAQADGGVSEAESGEIVEGLVQLTDGHVQADEIVDMLERVTGAVEEEGAKARFSEIASIIEDSELRDAVYLVACAVAWKGGGIGEKQGLCLRALKDAFGYAEGKHQALLAKAR